MSCHLKEIVDNGWQLTLTEPMRVWVKKGWMMIILMHLLLQLNVWLDKVKELQQYIM